MNYELSTEVIKILDDLAKRFGVAIDWASENVMPYLMELYDRFITYKIVINCIPIILFIIFATVFIVIMVKFFRCKETALETHENNYFVKVYKYWGEWEHYTTELFNTLAITFGILSGVFGLFAIFAIGTLLKLIFIPEVYMVQYLTNYMY